MLNSNAILVLILTFSVVLAGCSGITGTGNGAGEQHITCENGEIPSNTDLEQLFPEPSDNWTEVEIETVEVESDQGKVEVSPLEVWASSSDQKEFHATRYQRQSGGNYTLFVTRWPSPEEASNYTKYPAIFSTAAFTSGTIQISVSNSIEEDDHNDELLSQVPCVDIDEIEEINIFNETDFNTTVELNQTIEVNETEGINITTGTASLSDVNHEVVLSDLNNYEAQLDVEGEVENTNLLVELTDDKDNMVAQDRITEYELASGSATERLRLGDGPISGQYTLRIKQSDTGEIHYEDHIEIGEPDVVIDSLELDVTEYEYSGTTHFNGASFEVTNEGDISVFIGTGVIDYEVDSSSMMVYERLEPGETTSIDIWAYEELEDDVTVEAQVYSEDEELASASKST